MPSEPSADPTHDSASWRDAAFDVAWRIVGDTRTAIGIVNDAMGTVGGVPGADAGSTILVRTRRLALARRRDPEWAAPDRRETGVVFTEASAIDDDLVGRAEAAWGTAEAIGPDVASLLDLHLRFEVPPQALAEDLGTDREGAGAEIERLTRRLEGALGAWTLWNRGHPRCDDLARELRGEATDRFGPSVAQRVARHGAACEVCRVVLREQSAAAHRFATAPILRAPGRPGDPPAPVVEPAAGVEPPAVDDGGWDAGWVDLDEHGRVLEPEDDPADPSHDGDDSDDPEGGDEVASPRGAGRSILVGIALFLVAFAAVAVWVIATAPEAGGV